MPYANVNDTRLYYKETGTGEPLVFVHGGWSDHSVWGQVVPTLSGSHRVIAYDRRSHGRSERVRGVLPRRRHEDDLAGLLEALELAPAHVVGTSYGASTALGLAARRPELFRSVVAHEPPLLEIVGDDPVARAALAQTETSLRTVIERVEAGDLAGGAEQFVEEVALGPGMWAQLPEQMRAMMVHNAPAIVDEQRDPDWAGVDAARLAQTGVPVLLTQGDQSPAWFAQIVARLGDTVAESRVTT
ncbi:MAG: alpha/beta hydrolase, partial [Actinomycetota bacterium]|nr:alpha/beta hydrolase [Actinomycetota bacterium]